MKPAPPADWGHDGGDPTSPCEFRRFVNETFEPVPASRHLGKCGEGDPFLYGIWKLDPPTDNPKPIRYRLCTVHRGMANEERAQTTGRYRSIG